jgi:hypothetical protein
MRFLDYIANIETLSDTLIEGDGNCFFLLQVEGFGVPGDSGGSAEFPYLQAEGDGEQLPYAHIDFLPIEALTQDTNGAAAEFPAFEVQGQAGPPNPGNIHFPIIDCYAVGRSGNQGEYYFYMQAEGEGNANREYELCD